MSLALRATVLPAILLAANVAAEKAEGAAGVHFACETVRSANGEGTFAVAAVDLDGDGQLDLVASHSGSGTVSSHLNRGDRAFEPAGSWVVGRVPRGLAVADFDGDGHVDVAVANASSHDVVVLRGDGQGTLTAGRPIRAGWAPFHVRIADLDGDAHPDMIVVDESNWSDPTRRGTISLLRGRGDATFEAFGRLNAGVYPANAGWVRRNAGREPDLVVTHWSSGNLMLFRRDATRGFADGVDVVVPDSGPSYGLAVADLDGDGSPDIAITDLSGDVHLLRGDSAGVLAFWKSLETGAAGTRDVVAVDIDGDGVIDLVTANQHSHTVTLIRGLGKGEFAAPTAIGVGERPRSVTVADLDGDGKLDLVVANQGDGALSLLFQTTGSAVPCGSPPMPSPAATGAGGEDAAVDSSRQKRDETTSMEGR